MTFARGYQSLRVDHVGQRGRGIVGWRQHHEIGRPVPDRSNFHEKGVGP